jgi:hypothetical protein
MPLCNATAYACRVLVCPNPECTFARRHGRPAEYRETFTTCSDCGAALVAPSAVPPPAVAPAAAKPPAVGAPIGPVLLTAGLFVAMAALSYVKLIEVEGSPGLLGAFNRPTWMPPTSIGLNPFLGSFMIVGWWHCCLRSTRAASGRSRSDGHSCSLRFCSGW